MKEFYTELIYPYTGNTKVTLAHDGRITIKLNEAQVQYKERIIALAEKSAKENTHPLSIRGKVNIHKNVVKLELTDEHKKFRWYPKEA